MNRRIEADTATMMSERQDCPMSKKRRARIGERSALIALTGVTISVAVWFGHAYVDGVLFSGGVFASAVVEPDPRAIWSRLLTIVIVLIGTLLAQVLSARRADLDMTVHFEREQAATALRDSEERYRLLVENSPDMIAICSHERVSFMNPAGIRLLGLSSEKEASGLPVAELFEPNDPNMSPEIFRGALRGGTSDCPLQTILRRPDGTPVNVELRTSSLILAGEPTVQLVAHDITERLRAERTIRRMAYYDSLTDLPNRTLFKDRLRAALALARRTGTQVAVIFLDLDDFKTINDTLGHATGDEMLRLIGERLHSVVRDEDTVARLAGDEFTVIAHISSTEEADALADRLQYELSRPFELHGQTLHVTACLGIAIFPQDGDGVADLLGRADMAMYRAKEIGHHVQHRYQPEMGEEAAEQLELEMRLRKAFALHELELYYQPQVNMLTGRVIGIEALLRWNHPEQGLLLPDRFMTVAERSGLMAPIGHWVIEEACRQACEWRAHGLEFGHVGVNLSAREILRQDVTDVVSEVLRSTGLPPEALEIEITESTAMHNVTKVLERVEQLRSLGIRIAIDDFGTGHSSLSHLKRFPIQTIKIAQDFMGDVHRSKLSAAIARTIFDLCGLLGYDIVAEGVEHEDQLAFLSSQGCHVIQGFMFSPPCPAEEIPGLLAQGIPAFLTSQKTSAAV